MSKDFRTEKDLPPIDDSQLPNRKHELFCRFVSEGETYTAAYELAGYTPSTSNASILANKPEVKNRIASIKASLERREVEFRLAKEKLKELPPDEAEQAERGLVVWTADLVRSKLAENARLAQIAGEFAAANTSLKLIGESLHMFDKDKSDGGNAKGPQVSLTFVNEVLGGASTGSGVEPDEGDNPLRPTLRRPREALPVE